MPPSAEGARTLPARDVGASETLPLWVVNQTVNLVTWTERHSAAVVIARRGVALYPSSATAHVTLANALVAQGDTASARLSFGRALDIATAANDEEAIGNINERLREIGESKGRVR